MTERDIFLAARRHTESATREAFLAEACGADAALRQRIEQLLRADAAPGSLLRLAPGPLSDTDRPATRSWTPSGDEDISAEEGEDPLHFLVPSGQPGVLGRMDHYDILELVGKGGMGLVLKAFDARLHRVVAIKVMAPHLAVNATARQRFVREAQAGAAVNHRHVVAIHAVEAQHRPPYLVMEFVAGRSLADKVRAEGPADVQEILRIGSEIAGGLAAAHACGLIHRDIKPANILLEHKTERVKITDFGLARAANDASLTQSGQVAGTPKYMSPEQALGQHLDSRSDLFSLGGVLYFLCTAQAPFRAANTLAVLNQVVRDDPQPIQEFNPGIPDWLCGLVGKLLAKDAAQRFQSAQEVADILAQHLTAGTAQGIVNEPHAAGMGEAGAATVAWLAAGPLPATQLAVRRRRLVLWLAPVVGVTALALALAIAWFAQRGRQAPGEPGREGPGPGSEQQRNPGPEAPGPNAVAGKFQPFSPAILADRNAFRLPALERLRQGVPASCSCIPRGFSPDGKWLLTVSDGDPVVRVWNVATGKQHKELPAPPDITRGPTFSHDGALLAVFGIDGVLKLWDTRTFTPVRTLERQSVRIRSAAFNAEDRILATGRQDGTVQFWEVVTGRKLAQISASTFPVLGLEFLPCNKRLAVLAPDRQPTHNFQSDIWYYDCLVQSLDIDEKSANFGQTLYEWEAPDTQFILFAAAGERLYFLKHRYKANPCVGIADAATGKSHDLKLVPGIVPVTVLPVPGRGVLVGYADRVARFWNTETGKVEWEFGLPSSENYGTFALHPDGRTVAFGADDLPRVHFFDLITRQEISSPP